VRNDGVSFDPDLHERNAQSALNTLPKLAERAERARARAAEARVRAAGAAISAAERALHDRSMRMHERAETWHDVAALFQQAHHDHEVEVLARNRGR
jgi:uncharacterized protein (UPF0147 family)